MRKQPKAIGDATKRQYAIDCFTRARAQKRSALDERAAKELLAAYGIAVPRSRIVREPEEAATATGALTPPFAVKVISPEILHKSDAGGVRVNLRDAREVAGAIRSISASPAISAAKVDGYLVEEMAPPGVEIVVGGVCDPHFGPLVMVGLGGLFVEVLKDVSFRICPIANIDAEEMLGELRGAAILNGVRGGKPASRSAIVDALLKIGGENGLLLDHAADIMEADINPLIVSESVAVAVDARFILS